MGKGSVFVRAVAGKGLYAVLMVRGHIYMHIDRKKRLSSRKRKVRGVLYRVVQKIIRQLK
jgi:hypothetical protein